MLFSLFGQPQLTLVHLIDILPIHDLHGRDPVLAGRTKDVSALHRVIVYEDTCVILRDTVPVNLQQLSSRPFFIFNQLFATAAENGKNLVPGQLLQSENLTAVTAGGARPGIDPVLSSIMYLTCHIGQDPISGPISVGFRQSSFFSVRRNLSIHPGFRLIGRQIRKTRGFLAAIHVRIGSPDQCVNVPPVIGKYSHANRCPR